MLHATKGRRVASWLFCYQPRGDGGNIQIVLHMGAGRLGWAAKQVQALAAELVEGLSGLGRPSDAATVAATHLHDCDTAVHLFSQAHEWRQVRLSLHNDAYNLNTYSCILNQQSLRLERRNHCLLPEKLQIPALEGCLCVSQAACLAYQEGRDDLVETVIAPAAAEAAASLLSRALEDRKRVSKYLDRLKEASNACQCCICFTLS